MSLSDSASLMEYLNNLGLKDIIAFPDRLHFVGTKSIKEAQLPIAYVDDRGNVHEFLIKLGDLIPTKWPQSPEGTPVPADQIDGKKEDDDANRYEYVDLVTNHGTIALKLDRKAAPKTVENFLKYVEAGHYDGLIFHRVINGFMIQGGGFEPGLKQRGTQEPIQNEADNGLKNDVYTIAMARTNDPHSATAQFFINVNNNDYLNHSSKTPHGWGYAVFGEVVHGQDVVDKIKAIKTGNSGFHQDVPVEDVIITRAQLTPRKA